MGITLGRGAATAAAFPAVPEVEGNALTPLFDLAILLGAAFVLIGFSFVGLPARQWTPAGAERLSGAMGDALLPRFHDA